MAVLAEGTRRPAKIVNCSESHETAKLGNIFCTSVQKTVDLTIVGANPNAAPWCKNTSCFWNTSSDQRLLRTLDKFSPESYKQTMLQEIKTRREIEEAINYKIGGDRRTREEVISDLAQARAPIEAILVQSTTNTVFKHRGFLQDLLSGPKQLDYWITNRYISYDEDHPSNGGMYLEFTARPTDSRDVTIPHSVLTIKVLKPEMHTQIVLPTIDGVLYGKADLNKTKATLHFLGTEGMDLLKKLK